MTHFFRHEDNETACGIHADLWGWPADVETVTESDQVHRITCPACVEQIQGELAF